MTSFFSPAPHRMPVRSELVEPLYLRLRWQVLASTFFGYAIFYIVRNNLPPVAKEMGAALEYDKSMMGTILAGTALSYGVGKRSEERRVGKEV